MSKLQTVRQFCTTANAFLTDAQVARAISYIAGGVSKHYLLTHIERDMAYPQLNSPQNVVYARCRGYVLAALKEAVDHGTVPGKIAPSPTILGTKLSTLEKKNGYEFSAHFHEAFKALQYLEVIVDEQDTAYNLQMIEMQEHKDWMLDQEMPWENMRTKR